MLAGFLRAVHVAAEDLADEAGHAGGQPGIGLVVGFADAAVQLDEDGKIGDGLAAEQEVPGMRFAPGRLAFIGVRLGIAADEVGTACGRAG